MTHGPDGPLPPAEADLLCQVCGAPLEGRLLWCRHCDTPHHADCWEFNGGCSTFGCGSKRARGTPPTSTTAPVDEPLLLSVADDAPPVEVADFVRNEGPVLVIDDDATLPGRPRPASPSSILDPSAFARNAAAWARRLPGTAAWAACRVGETLCWPGWLVAHLAYFFAKEQGSTSRGGSSLASRLIEWSFGTEVLIGLRTLVYFLALWSLAGGLLADSLGPDGLAAPLVLYMLLSPPLKLVFADLDSLELPPADEEAQLTDDAEPSTRSARRKKRRRSRKRRQRR